MGKFRNFILQISGVEKRSFIKNELSYMGPGKVAEEETPKAKKGKKNGK